MLPLRSRASVECSEQRPARSLGGSLAQVVTVGMLLVGDSRDPVPESPFHFVVPHFVPQLLALSELSADLLTCVIEGVGLDLTEVDGYTILTLAPRLTVL